jgi:F0F1-type ATP synthase assembly protein I
LRLSIRCEPLVFNAPQGRIEAVSTESANSDAGRPEPESARFARMAVWLLRLQGLLGVVAAVVGALFGGAGAALAVLAGSGIGIILTAVSALRSAVLPPDADAARVVAAFHRGMILKMALAVVLFVIVAALFSEWFLPVVAGYAVTLAAYWVALVRVGRDGGDNAAADDE